jgi:hypothetical protein
MSAKGRPKMFNSFQLFVSQYGIKEGTTYLVALTTVKIKIAVFWMTSCRLIDRYQHFFKSLAAFIFRVYGTSSALVPLYWDAKHHIQIIILIFAVKSSNLK